jgi:hypothetical protein
MATEQIAIDVNLIPGLGDLAKAVRRDQKSRILQRGGQALAKVVPIMPSNPRTRTSADHEAFLSSAGGWKGIVDTAKFLAGNSESRRLSSRPPVET